MYVFTADHFMPLNLIKILFILEFFSERNTIEK